MKKKYYNYLILSMFIFSVLPCNAQEQYAALSSKSNTTILKSKITCERKNDDMGKCFSCHNKNGWKDMKYIHGPVVMNECRPCHIKPNNIKDKKTEIALSKRPCIFCHQLNEIKKIHPDKCDDDDIDCNDCHDPHASNEKYFLR